MADYDFLNLSPPEFEELSRDLLQKHLRVTLESFTNGKDGGIDLRYCSFEKKNLIIQCKRYREYNSLIINLGKEVAKVQKLKPARYIICTTVGLTPHRKEIILQLFLPFIKNTADIFGRDDLNNLLAVFPEVEKAHFKLWLSSVHILEKILHSKIHNQSNFEEEAIKATINLYVDNNSFYNAISIINEKNYVIISGIPGIGKTTLARILAYYFLANGYEEFIFLSDSIDDGYTSYKEGVKQLFLFDDFLGTNFLENKLTNNEEQRIVRFIDRVSKSPDKIIILTTREYILAQAKQKYDVFERPDLEFAKCIIDLSEYTKVVKARILYNHLFFSNIPDEYIVDLLKNKNYKKIIEHPNYNPRIIQTITNDTIWKTIKPSEFASKFLDFIKNPVYVWKHVYENQISALSQCILANMMSAGAPVILEDLKKLTQDFAKIHFAKYGIAYNEMGFRKSIRELENTFIKTNRVKENNIIVEYQNPSVQDFLVYYFKENHEYVTDILHSTSCFNQLFHIFSYWKDFPFSTSNRILLNEAQINIAINKIINDFDYLNSTVVSRHSFNFHRIDTPDYLKMDEILTAIKIENYPELKAFLISRFKAILIPADYQLSHHEIIAYINLVEAFKPDIICNEIEILNRLAESISDMQDFEEFEKLENILGDVYIHHVATDSRHRDRISALLEIQAENAEDDSLEDTLDEVIKKGEKYGVDYAAYKRVIVSRIKELENDDHRPHDWEPFHKTDSENDDYADNKLITNLFDSLRANRDEFEGFAKT